jgi:hypothetical protein
VVWRMNPVASDPLHTLMACKRSDVSLRRRGVAASRPYAVGNRRPGLTMHRRPGSVGGRGNRPGAGHRPRVGAAAPAASGSRSWCRRRGRTARFWRPARPRWPGRRRAAPRTAPAALRSAGPGLGRARCPLKQTIEHLFETMRSLSTWRSSTTANARHSALGWRTPIEYETLDTPDVASLAHPRSTNRAQIKTNNRGPISSTAYSTAWSSTTPKSSTTSSRSGKTSTTITGPTAASTARPLSERLKQRTQARV